MFLCKVKDGLQCSDYRRGPRQFLFITRGTDAHWICGPWCVRMVLLHSRWQILWASVGNIVSHYPPGRPATCWRFYVGKVAWKRLAGVGGVFSQRGAVLLLFQAIIDELNRIHLNLYRRGECWFVLALPGITLPSLCAPSPGDATVPLFQPRVDSARVRPDEQHIPSTDIMQIIAGYETSWFVLFMRYDRGQQVEGNGIDGVCRMRGWDYKRLPKSHRVISAEGKQLLIFQ
jgi:hypothetical protein